MTCPTCINKDYQCERTEYRQSQLSGWHIEQSEDLHRQTHTFCGLVFPAMTRSTVAPVSGLCLPCLYAVHPQAKIAAETAAQYWDD